MQNVQIPPSDSRIQYEGRWIINGTTSHGNAARADWPCSGIHFIVEVQCGKSKYVYLVSLLDKAPTCLVGCVAQKRY